MAQNERLNSVMIDNARIIFRNFAGAEGQYNAAGDRNFGVVLPPDVAEQMKADGWNVKYLKAREEGDEVTPWVPVAVSYKGRPPKIVMITHRGNPPVPVRVTLPEDLVELVDFADIAKADMILNPYSWSVRGESGVKAYLKSLYITVQQDELERRYANVEEVDLNGAPLAIESNQNAITDESNIIDGEVIEDEEELIEG